LISFLSEINISRWAHIDSIRNSERRGEPKLLMYGLWPVWCLFCVSKYRMVLAITLHNRAQTGETHQTISLHAFVLGFWIWFPRTLTPDLYCVLPRDSVALAL
jgi:hypothetical protein